MILPLLIFVYKLIVFTGGLLITVFSDIDLISECLSRGTHVFQIENIEDRRAANNTRIENIKDRRAAKNTYKKDKVLLILITGKLIQFSAGELI